MFVQANENDLLKTKDCTKREDYERKRADIQRDGKKKLCMDRFVET